MKFTPSPALRISLGLLSLSLTLLLVVDLLFGVFPTQGKDERQRRQHTAERLASRVAAQYIVASSRVATLLPELLGTDPALRSIALRRSTELIAATRDHELAWRPADKAAQGHTQFVIPLAGPRPSETPWGHVEVAYQPIERSAWSSPLVRAVLFFTAATALLFYLYLRRAFEYLDPRKVVPQRVQMAFDALSEGVIVLDDSCRIVMSNKAFNALCPDTGTPPLGQQPQSLRWLRPSRPQEGDPWLDCLQLAIPVQGIAYEATPQGQGGPRKLVVSCSPVLDDGGSARGCVVSFADVTALDAAHRRVVELMEELRGSKEQLERQNADLERMATEDPMTGVTNRRSFFPLLESLFEKARADGTPLAVLMADIDKFKSINDVYGHAVGDRVIQGFAALLKRSVRQTDIVCRYGGEEFCIALPGADARLAIAIADRLRSTTAEEGNRWMGVDNAPTITASFGIADMTGRAASVPELVDQADQALYMAKRGGRNRWVYFDHKAKAVVNERA